MFNLLGRGNVVAHLPDPINEIAWFGYLSGWRKGEILSLRWDMVDRAAKEVRIRTSKNGQGRVLPLRGDLWNLIERRWTARKIEKKDGTTKMAEAVSSRRRAGGGLPRLLGRGVQESEGARGNCFMTFDGRRSGTWSGQAWRSRLR